jgi:lamin B
MANRSSASLRSRNASGNTSGLNLSRAQEKEQLETLNNRLAVYIDTVRRLEHDNKELKNIIASYSDTYEVETSKVKQLYERELEDAKKLIEELAREKSRLEIEAEKANAESQEALAKLARKERDLRAAEGRLKQYETEIGDLKARNEALGFDANRKTDENVGLRGTNSDLDKQVNALKRQLEAETLLRVDLENKNKTLREELQFNAQVHETAIDEIRRQRTYNVKSFDDGLRQQYDDRLLNELQELRLQTDQEMQALRDEIAGQYQKKIEDLEKTIRRNTDQVGAYRSDVTSYRERIEDITKSRDALNDKVLYLEQRCRDLEDRLHHAQEKQDQLLSEREDDIERLKQQIEQMQIDYQNLLDIKIGLDREIATYRKLLESEEERLNISGNASRLDGSSIANTTFETSSQPSRKRPRYDPDDHPSVNTKLIEGINIIDDESSQPKFVKLINNAKQDVALHGWILKRKVGSQSYEFKFPKGMVLKAGATTTIWSSDVNDISVDPPTNLKLRTTKWFSTGKESKKTILEDSEGHVIAEKTVTIK